MRIRCRFDEMIPLSVLKTLRYPKNPNKHSKEQIEQLAQIMCYQGIRHPIVIAKSPRKVMSKGHGRLLAAIENGWHEFPVEYQDYDSEEMLYVDVVADNAIAMQAELDLSAINLEVPDLGPDFDIDLLGMKDFEIEPADKYQEGEDDVPEPCATDIKLGDLFNLGAHRLLCGDSTDRDMVERLMNGEKADMVYTDPPYGIDYDAQSLNYTGAKHFGKIANDSETPNLENVWSFHCNKIVFGANNFPELLPHRGRWACWDKRSDSLDDTALADKVFGSHFELAWVDLKSGLNFIFRLKHGGPVNRDGGKRVHPTQKPTQLIVQMLERYKAGILIIDLYLGSGSTLIACEKTNRKCFGMEIDPQYCQVIIDRWEKFTGKKAEKL